MRWVGFLAILWLIGCVVGPMTYAPDGSGMERPWSESYTIQQQGKCEPRCTRYGNTTKCREYRC